MYSVLPSFVLGFHGCEKTVADRIFSGSESLKSSTNEFDWLGHGIYFWENNPDRALDFAVRIKKIKTPEIIGAVIDLGYCLNLLDEKSIRLIKTANDIYLATCDAEKINPVENRDVKSSADFPLRYRDCAVIESLHKYRQTKKQPEFDSVRGLFSEGLPIYKNAGFREKNHIQICIRNPNCIKGYFRVLASNENWSIP